MLRTLRSDTKINILNPNLDVKMFIKGVQTYVESLFSVPFVPNKKMLWLALKIQHTVYSNCKRYRNKNSMSIFLGKCQ